MMTDHVLVELISTVAALFTLQPKTFTGNKPKKIALPAAVRAIALMNLRELSFDLKRDVAAMATSRVHGITLSYSLVVELDE